MNSTLSVGVVIAAHSPAAWVCELLSKLQLHSRINLQTVIFIDGSSAEKSCKDTSSEDEPSSAQSSAEKSDADHTSKEPDRQNRRKWAGALSYVARWILLNKIDKPRFSQNPWQITALPDGITALGHLDASSALTRCEVVLNLCRDDLPPQLAINPETCIWNAQIDTLDSRIENALLDQQPLTWIHLWSQSSGTSREWNPAKLIASHALPRQSYSLTDLRRAAYFSLPSLFTSRLNWLAQQSELLDLEVYNPAISCSSIRKERSHYNKLAESYVSTDDTHKPFSDAGYFLRVIKLWYRQTLQRFSDRIWIEQWQLALFNHDQDLPSFISDIAATKLDDYRAIASPSDMLRADPHVLEHNGRMHVLFEEMKTTGSKAHISCATLDKSGQIEDHKVVLQEEQHLSYPFVFTDQGITYMIPETASRNTVSLYRTHNFPERWEYVSDLLIDINAADTTLVHHENRWWLFTNSQSHRAVDERDELLLYYANHVTGPWQAHPLNPVLTGVDRARMAGPIIVENGVLHRPSQYGAVRYGYGINLNRIEQLDTTHYRETPVARILPEHGSRWEGCHSITQGQGVTIIDRTCRQRR